MTNTSCSLLPPSFLTNNTDRTEKRKEKGYLIILTRRWALSSWKSSYIWPKSAALPWEYKMVKRATGCLQKVAMILLPPLVSSIWTSMFLSVVTPCKTSFPLSSICTSYVGGYGGKNANFAATFDVTFPISQPKNFQFLFPLISFQIWTCIVHAINIRPRRGKKRGFFGFLWIRSKRVSAATVFLNKNKGPENMDS